MQKNSLNQESIEQLVKEAEVFIKEGKYDDAYNKYNLALQSDPANKKLSYHRGQTLIKLNRFEEAFEDYKAAINLSYPLVPEDLIFVISQMKDQEKAISQLQEIITKKNLEYNFQIWAKILFKLGKTEESFEQLKRLIKSGVFITDNELIDIFKSQKEFEIQVSEIQKEIDKDNNERKIYNWGKTLNKLEKYDQAIYNLSKLKNKADQFPAIYLDIGDALYSQKKFEEAIEYYIKDTSLNNFYYYKEIADTYLKLSDKKKKRYLEKIINLTDDENHTSFYLNLGTEIFNANDYSSAVQLYKKSLLLSPNEIIYYNIGLALYYSGKYNEVLEYTTSGINANKEYLNTYNLKGLALIQLERYDDAIQQFEYILSRKDDIYALRNYGWVLQKKGVYDKSIELLKKALTIENTNPDIYNELGNTYLAINDFDSAIVQYQKAIELDDKHHYAIRNWGLALSKQNKKKEAEEKYLECIKVKPDYAEVYNDLGNLYLDHFEYEKAISYYNKSKKIDPKFIYPYRNIGVAFSKQGKTDEAIKELNDTLILFPDDAATVNDLGNIYLDLKDFNKAISLYQQATLFNPAFTYAYRNWGLALSLQGKYEEALLKYEKTLSIDPDYHNIYVDLVTAAKKLNRYDKAFGYLKKGILNRNNFYYSDLYQIISRLNNHQHAVDEIHSIVADIDRGEIYYLWAQTLSNLNQYQRAFKHLKSAVQKKQNFYSFSINPIFASLEDKEQSIKEFQELIDQVNDTNAYIQWGNTLNFLHSPKQAIENYKKAASETNLNIFLDLGNAYDQINEKEKALDCYQQCIKNKMSYFSTDLSNFLIRLGEKEKVVKKIQILVDETDDESIYYDWGKTLQTLNRYNDAAINFKKAIKKNKKDARYFSSLAVALDNSGHPHKAIVQYKKALQNKKWFFSEELSGLILKQNNPDETIESIRKIIKKVNDNYTRIDWIHTLIKLNQFELAYEEIKNNLNSKQDFNSELITQIIAQKKEKEISIQEIQAKADHFDEPKIYFEWAEALFKINQVQDSLKNYLKIIDDPQYKPEVNYALGKIYSYLNDPASAEEYFSQALKLGNTFYARDLSWAIFKSYDTKKSIKEYTDLIEKMNYPEVINELGNLFFELKLYDNAINYYKKAIEIDPYYKWSYHNWGMVLLELKNYDDAISKFKAALEKDKSYESSYLNWAKSICNHENPEYGLKDFEDTSKKNITSSKSIKAIGDIFLEQDFYTEAAKYFLFALELDRYNEDIYTSLRKSLSNTGDFNTTTNFIEQLKKTTYNHPKALKTIGDVYIDWGKYSNAIACYRSAIEVNPVYKDAFSGLIQAACRSGEPDKELSALVPLIEGNLSGTHAFTLMGNINYEKKDYIQAIEFYQKALYLDLTNKEAYEGWGKTIRASENTEGFAIDLERFVDKHPNAFGYLILGNIMKDLKRYEEAKDACLKAVQLDPDFNKSYITWMEILCLLDYKEDMVIGFIDTIQTYLQNSFAYCTIADVQLSSGLYKESIHYYRKAIELDPLYEKAYTGWASALAKLENAKDDIAYFKEISGTYLRTSVSNKLTGDIYYNLNDYVQSAASYKKAVDNDPDFENAYIGWGNALAKLTYENEDLKDLESQITRNLDITISGNILGKVHFELNHIEKAKSFYKNAILKRPNFIWTYYNLGSVLLNELEYKEAITLFKSALKLDPKFYKAYHGLGEAYFGLNNIEMGMKQLQKVIREGDDEEIAVAYNMIGSLNFDLGEFEKAENNYQYAVERSPRNESCLINYSNCLINTNKLEEAHKVIDRALLINPRNEHAYFIKGCIFEKTRSYQQAITMYSKVMELNPNYVYGLHKTAQIQLRNGDFEKSWRTWDNVVSLYYRIDTNPEIQKDAEFYFNYGNVKHQIYGELEEAKRIYNKGLHNNPDHIGILISLTSLYMELNKQATIDYSTNYINAIETYTKAKNLLFKKSIKNKSYFQQLGILHLSIENFADADKDLKSAWKTDNYCLISNKYLGLLNYLQDNKNEALQYLKAAHAIDPEDLTLWSYLAATYLNNNQYDLAEQEYHKILKVAPNHIESHIGMGELYVAMADKEEKELYEDAIRHYDRAFKLSQFRKGSYLFSFNRNRIKEEGSVRLRNKEIADLLYSRGYAKIKLYESNKLFTDLSFLNEAKEDFRKCLKIDPDHLKAHKALKKLDKRIGNFLSPQKIRESYAPLIVVFLSFFVFLAGQFLYFFGKPVFQETIVFTDAISFTNYVILSFNALLFLIAGLYLPQILKIKFGTLELEKDVSVKQMKPIGPIGIEKTMIIQIKPSTQMGLETKQMEPNRPSTPEKKKKEEDKYNASTSQESSKGSVMVRPATNI